MNNEKAPLEQSEPYAWDRTPPHPLRLYRIAAGLTAGELADMAGCHRNTVSNIERRRNLASRSTARKLSDALNLSVLELFPEYIAAWDAEE